MDIISLEQLQKLFADLRSETDWDIDGEMLWGYYFLDQDRDKLTEAGAVLGRQGYDVAGVYENDEEPGYILHVQRVEVHTPESLHARNAELAAFAQAQGLASYDGMDVSPYDPEGEEGGFENPEDPDFPTREEEVSNPGLVAALDALDDSDEAQLNLGEELQGATYLIPVANAGEAGDDNEVPFSLLVCTNDEGGEYIPLFTDLESLKAWTSETEQALIFSADEAWELVLSQEGCAGAVINPNTHSLMLDREQVQLLYDELLSEYLYGEDEEFDDLDDEEEKKE